MRVLHVTITDGADGAGIAALRLHKCLREAGVESQMLVKFKRSDDDHVHEINKFPLLDYICNAFTYWVSFRHWFTMNAIFIRRHRLFRAADIIHVHNIQYESFFSPLFFPTGRSIAWTLHDMWAITGNCNYTFNLCEKYVNGCGKCPLNKGGPSTAFEYLKRLIPWRKASVRS